MKRFASTFLGLVFMVSLLGCRHASPFAKDGIPKQRYLVGGGFEIEYRAQRRGMLWLVEENSRKTILSQYIDEGNIFQKRIDPANKGYRELFEKLGINMPDARLSLYLVPGK